jgi:FKBP-type peptidyl-prolyl cis-trans isomerase (trigger factor)
MKPDVDLTLQLIAASLMTEVAPKISDDYTQRNSMLTAMLLQIAAEEWDRAAARRVEENGALRRLFAEAAPEIEDRELRARLEAASGEEEESVRISDLNRSNDRLRRLLIELHAHLEEIDTETARRIETAIWEELRVSTERRAVSVAPF